MDLATIIGLVMGIGAIIGGFLMEGGSLRALVEPSAAIIVIPGTLGATLIGFSLKHTSKLPNIVKNAFQDGRIDRLELVRLIVNLAKQARRSGILTLESEARNLENHFLRNAIQLVVDGTQPELVREILETEVDAMKSRHSFGAEFFASMGGYSPTLGIIGTVMGLVHMLENLDKPGSMGPAIATAFIATLYGVSLANLVYLPLSSKLKDKSKAEAASYEMAIEGILSLQAGDNPRIVALKMRPFLSTTDKRLLDTEE